MFALLKDAAAILVAVVDLSVAFILAQPHCLADYAFSIWRKTARKRRSYLFEAAGVLLTRVPKWSALKAWGSVSTCPVSNLVWRYARRA